MGMIRRADLEQVSRNALVMNLGDLGAHARSMIEEARAQAGRILAEARAERDRLVATAREDGFRQGRAEGFEKGRAEGEARGREDAAAESSARLGAVAAAWAEALDRFESDRDRLLQAARCEVVELAAEIASRVTRRAIDLDPGVVSAQIESVLAAVARPSKLLIRVHPADLERAAEDLPGLLERFDRCRHADLAGDPSLTPGSCVATTEEGGRIDAEITGQLARIIAELVPGDQSAGAVRRPRGDAA